jgi:STE24 endopeptidase
MSVCLLVALILAFGLRPGAGGATVAAGEVTERLQTVALLGLVLPILAALAGRRIEHLARSRRREPTGCRRLLARCNRTLDALGLALYAWILYGLDWPGLVEDGLGLRDAFLADEALILAPFVWFQLGTWWGLAPAELALRSTPRPRRGDRPRWRLLVRRARQSFGLVLPAALAFTVAQDALRRYSYEAFASPWVQLGGLALMGACVLVLAPALVRIAWPTTPLPPGPLRDRLQLLAARLNFRFTDILVWDTDRSAVNAGVTGALPFFRYVLLTDSLVANLDESQIEAVFGHEVGHIAHRHLAFFGFFFVGSMGIMALVGQGLSWLAEQVPGPAGGGVAGVPFWAVELVASAGWIAAFVAYVLLVFGHLSRRFERQADVFGCRAISCGRADCPPHEERSRPAGGDFPLCPTGIQTFSSALELVAILNGMEPGAGSWRHGSIRDRIRFLDGLVGRPERELRFQGRIRLLRVGLAAGLLAGLAAAIATGALEQL